MIPKKLVQMCGKHKIISMFEDKESKLKWLSAGRVAACVGGDCEITPNSILFFLGVSEESKDSYFIQYEQEKDLPNTSLAENVERLKYSLNINGDTLQPFATPHGILFVNIKSLAIFADSKEELTYKFTRWNKTPVLLVMEYNSLIGIIPPVMQDYEKLIDFVDKLSYNVDLADRNNFLSLEGKQVSLFDNDIVLYNKAQDNDATELPMRITKATRNKQ